MLRHIKGHAVCTRIQIHLMQILMHINIGQDPAAERIIFQIINHPVHLIHHSLTILMFLCQLIAVRFSDGTVFICPFIPDGTV